MRSAGVFAGTAGWTTRMVGAMATIETGMRSRAGSKRMFAYRLGLAASPTLAISSV